METVLQINYWAIGVGAISAMVLGALWYGPIFGKKWMDIIGVDAGNKDAREAMQKSAGPLYGVQFILVLFQVVVLAHLVADTSRVSGVERALWIFMAFVIPTLAGSVIWTNEDKKMKWARFLIQGGYYLVSFIIFGLLLQFWK